MRAAFWNLQAPLSLAGSGVGSWESPSSGAKPEGLSSLGFLQGFFKGYTGSMRSSMTT